MSSSKNGLWPGKNTVLSVTTATISAFQQVCGTLRIDDDLSPLLKDLYLPLAGWLLDKHPQRNIVLGVCGGQGSGKSTFSLLLSSVLRSAFNASSVILSIDDLYKTRDERKKMAQEIHPLFATRGVPGTHDVQLGVTTINRLKSLNQDSPPVCVPRFDKATDDRAPIETWPRISTRPDVIIFEGWCVGARPEAEDTLSTPINTLERTEDADGRWRNFVNKELAGQYRELFALLDDLVLLKVPSFGKVVEWRKLQEHKLAQSLDTARTSPPTALRIMSDTEIERFVQHYERLTRHILTDMPEYADIVIDIGNDHQPTHVSIKSSNV